MAEIQYILKPDWISWADIKECMYQAHAMNRKKGVVMQNQFMNEAEFAEYYRGALCFVALDEGKAVGTVSTRFLKRNTWWAHGLVAYNFGDAILKAYQGTDVTERLNELRLQEIDKAGIRIISFDTAEHNQLVQKINLKRGARRIKLYASRKTWYYSVVMVIWRDGCPFSERYTNFRFALSAFLVKLIWKPGRKVRFWFH